MFRVCRHVWAAWLCGQDAITEESDAWETRVGATSTHADRGVAQSLVTCTVVTGDSDDPLEAGKTETV